MKQAFDGMMGSSRWMLKGHHPTNNVRVVQRWGDTPMAILRDVDMEDDHTECEPKTLRVTPPC